MHSAGVFAVLLAALIAPGAFAQVQHVTNPYAGATVYLNPDYAKEVSAAVATEPAGSTLAAQMAAVGSIPTFIWMDHIGAIAGGTANNGRMGLAAHIAAALSQQKGTVPIVVQLVIYDLPDRDCAALASNGELSIAGGDTPIGSTTPLMGTGIQEYENDYITPIYNILAPYATNSNIRFVLVIEDDSLPNMITNTGLSFSLPNCVAANDGQSYPTLSLNGVYVLGIQYALNTFHQLPNAYNYLDVGHHGWLGWPVNSAAAFPFFFDVASGTTAKVNSVDGFITNTANYGPTKEPYMTATESIGGADVYTATFYQFDPEIDEEDYAAEFDAGLIAAGFPSTLGFLIDTSRNGWGGPLRPTAASTSTVLNTFVEATKIDERDDMGQWCNQENQGLGVPPTVTPGYFTNLNAYVWVKPPGESDGNYPGSVYNGVTSTTGDPNCDPAHSNMLANNMLTGAIPNSPPAGTFWITEFAQDVQNAFPPVLTTPFGISGTGTVVMQGTSAASSIIVSTSGGFDSPVALTVSGLPVGVTASFSPASVTGAAGSSLTFTASATAAVGPATITVTGTSGSTVESTTLTLTVTAEPNFTISVSPAAVNLPPNTNPTSTITVTYVGGLTGSVQLSASNLPSGVGANFAPSSFNSPGGTSVVNFTSQASTPAGTTNILITGTDGLIVNSATIVLTVPGATCAAVPSAPTVTATAASSSVIDVSWTAVTPPTNCTITSYSVYRSTTTGFTPSSSTLVGTVTSGTTFADTGLTASTTYFYKVEASDADGASAASTQVSATTLPVSTCTAVPSAPTVTATAASSSVVNVSWTAVTPPTNCTITSYSVYRSTTTGFTPSSSTLVGTVASGTTFADTGLTASTTYFYKVEASDADGTSAASTQVSATTLPVSTCTAVPSAPTVTATAASSSVINVSWTAVTPPTNCTIASYSVYRSTTTGFTPSSSTLVGTVTSGTTFADTGLTASTTYYYKVEASDADGASAASTQVSATTLPGGGPSCHIVYTITSQWPGGFGAAITIDNTGSTALSNWTLTWAFANGQTITQLWNGNETQSGANVTVTNMSYNGNIPAGGNYSAMGFNGTWNNTTNAIPVSFAVNGTTCN